MFCELGMEGIPRCGFGAETGLSRAVLRLELDDVRLSEQCQLVTDG